MSRPLRAFTIVIVGWTLIRVGVLWHVPFDIALPPAAARLADRARLAIEGARTQARAHGFSNGSVTVVLDEVRSAPPVRVIRSTAVAITDETGAAPRLSIMLDPATPASMPASEPAPRLASVPPSLPPTGRNNRLSGSAWALLRRDSAGAALGTGGTLGGSQAGARFFYESGLKKLALTARISAPLAMRTGREASVGVAIRGRSVGILLERRVALDHGARNAMSITAYGGISDIALPHGFVLDGYGQFGIVGIRSRDRFGDGALRILHPILRSDAMVLSVGGSVSGGFQPNIARLDIGPEIVADLSVAATPVRMSIGWRQRVAGRAAPGSGPSVSIGFGF